jgi:hypothetical protein
MIPFASILLRPLFPYLISYFNIRHSKKGNLKQDTLALIFSFECTAVLVYEKIIVIIEMLYMNYSIIEKLSPSRVSFI